MSQNVKRELPSCDYGNDNMEFLEGSFLACHRSRIFKPSRTHEIFRKKFSDFFYITYLLARKNNPFAQINLKFWGKVTKFNFGYIGIFYHFLQTLSGPRTGEIFRKKFSDFFI